MLTVYVLLFFGLWRNQSSLSYFTVDSRSILVGTIPFSFESSRRESVESILGGGCGIRQEACLNKDAMRSCGVDNRRAATCPRLAEEVGAIANISQRDCLVIDRRSRRLRCNVCSFSDVSRWMNWFDEILLLLFYFRTDRKTGSWYDKRVDPFVKWLAIARSVQRFDQGEKEKFFVSIHQHCK